jgi:class 3 adenylate cyclase
MVFFNDPEPVEHHELEAIRMALSIQAGFGDLAETWRRRGSDIGLGIGIPLDMRRSAGLGSRAATTTVWSGPSRTSRRVSPVTRRPDKR